MSSLIRPRLGISPTSFDVRQTGISRDALVNAPPIEVVILKLESAMAGRPVTLVAHNATYEANIVGRFADRSTTLGKSHFVDTLRLARSIVPGLESYRLDALATHFNLEVSSSRHRAEADVALLVNVFERLISCGSGMQEMSVLLRQAHVSSSASRPEQTRLFA